MDCSWTALSEVSWLRPRKKSGRGGSKTIVYGELYRLMTVFVETKYGLRAICPPITPVLFNRWAGLKRLLEKDLFVHLAVLLNRVGIEPPFIGGTVPIGGALGKQHGVDFFDDRLAPGILRAAH